MYYFDSLPKLFNADTNGSITLLTDILTRAKIIDTLEKNPLLFYKYNIQDGDTPEIIADKYYNDSYRYWIVLYANKIMDPLWDWPLDYQQLQKFIDNKYMPDPLNPVTGAGVQYAQSTIYEYRKILTTIDGETDQVTTKKFSIDETTYNSLPLGTNVYTFPNGLTSTVTIDKESVTYYDYENETNEAKREINILNSIYVSQIEKEFMDKMK